MTDSLAGIGGPPRGQLAITLDEWRVNWRVGLAASIGMALGGSVLATIFSLFVLPLEEAFGWSRGEVSLAASAGLVGGFLAPFLGRLIDRTGARAVLITSFSLLIVFWLGLAAMPGSLVVFYALYLGLAVSGQPASGLGFAQVICAAFVRSRGISLAIGRGGLSVSAIVLPLVLFAVMDRWGIRAGYGTMAILVALLALPAAIFWLPRRQQASDADAVTQEPAPVSSLWSVFTDRRAVTIAIAAAAAYAAILSIQTHAQPLLVGKGLTGEQGASLIGLFGLTAFLGAFGTGFLLDRFWAPAVATALLSLGAIGSLVLALMPGTLEWSALGVVLIGFSLGAEIDIGAYVVARYCGLRSYSSVYGLTVLMISIAASVAAPAMGFLYEVQGDYRLALICCAIAYVFSILAYLSLGRYPEQPD